MGMAKMEQRLQEDEHDQRALADHREPDPDRTSIADYVQWQVLFLAGKWEDHSQDKRTSAQMQIIDDSSRKSQLNSTVLLNDSQQFYDE